MILRVAASLMLMLVVVPLAHACTAFVVYRNGLALAGNNEDFWETDTKIWFVPKEGSKRGAAGKVGRIYFGFNNFFAQGGMNEAGLFFDGFATAENKVKDSINRPTFKGNLIDHVMANCRTVSEVVAELEKFNLSFLGNAMLMFADQHGDSVIVEGDDFLRIKGDSQAVTNFYQSKTPPGQCPCPRYAAAVKALDKGEPISVEACQKVLGATRQNVVAPTQYSNVYDLKKGLVYLYHFHDFKHVVCLNLQEELAKGPHEIDLPSLFPKSERFEKFKASRIKNTAVETEKRRLKDLTSINFADYEGTFWFEPPSGEKVKGTIALEEKQLVLRLEQNGQTKKQMLIPEKKDLFFRIAEFGLETYQFGRNDEKLVDRLTLKVFGTTVEAKRAEQE